MQLDLLESQDHKLRRNEGGELQSNFRPPVGAYAQVGKARDQYISSLETLRDVMHAAGAHEAAKRYAIQAEFERAEQARDSYRRQADSSRNQDFRDLNERRAREAEHKRLDSQARLARLDTQARSQWEKTAETRLADARREIDQRQADERRRVDERKSMLDTDAHKRTLDAREADYRQRIEPKDRERYDGLVDDIRARYARMHGKDVDSYVMPDRERLAAHAMVVDRGYGQETGQRIHEVSAAREAAHQDLDRRAFNRAADDRQAAQRLSSSVARSQLDPSPDLGQPASRAERDALAERNDAVASKQQDGLAQGWMNQDKAASERRATAQETGLKEAMALKNAGFHVRHEGDHVAYSKPGSVVAAVRDYGHRISSNPSELRTQADRSLLVAAVAERFPKGFEIRCSDEERKLDYAREAVRQGHADKIANPELKEFVQEYRQQYADEQRRANETDEQQADQAEQREELQERDVDRQERSEEIEHATPQEDSPVLDWGSDAEDVTDRMPLESIEAPETSDAAEEPDHEERESNGDADAVTSDEMDLSHLPEDIAESIRETMEMERQLRAQREAESEQESQRQSGAQTQ